MRLAVLTNIIPPYRVPLYEELVRLAGDVTVFITGSEDNRQWPLRGGRTFRVEKTACLVVKRKRHRYGIRDFDTSYFHLPVGLPLDLTRLRPDAVVSMQMGMRTLQAYGYCLVKGVPLAVQWEGTVHTEAAIGGFKRLVRRAFFARRMPAWVAYGSDSTEYLLSLGVERDRILEVMNCVSNELFAGPAEPALDLRPKPVLLTVGQFIPRKGIMEYLHAISVLQGKGYSFTTLLVGSGSEETRLKEAARRMQLEHVVFHPFVQLPVLPGIYRSADVFVFPTLEDVWGLVVNEAMASELPVLCSKYAGSAADLVPEAWQFDPLDIEGSFAPALETVLRRRRGAREEFAKGSALTGPRQAAETILAAIRKASASR